jgi:DNA-binding CsgD family transcriptional regulator
MARPKKKIDGAEVVRFASNGASNREIADFVGVDEGTIRNRFSAIIRKERAELRYRLRKAQIDLALSGNATMLIWLGKVMLEQREYTEPERPPESVEIVIGGKPADRGTDESAA